MIIYDVNDEGAIKSHMCVGGVGERERNRKATSNHLSSLQGGMTEKKTPTLLEALQRSSRLTFS